MYTITCDGNLLYDPRVDDLKVANAKLQLEVNRSGSFDFTIYPAHPLYGTIQKLKSVIEVYQDGLLLFRGRVLNDRTGLFLNKEFECEGDLAFFNDTIMRPFEYTGNLVGFIQLIIDSHNAQAGADKQFTLGNVTVVDPNDFITRSSIEHQTSWEVIENRLIKNLGGYIMVRRSGGVNYIDYLADSTTQSLQELKLEENILDIIKDTRSDTIITALIPLGAKLMDEHGNETDQRLTISSVNGGLDYVHDAAAVTQYGWIFGTKIWDDVTDANNLLTRANQELAVRINLGVSVELKAIDLSMIDTNIDEIRVFEYVQVTSEPHGINAMALITKLSINMLDPKQNTFTLGFSYDTFTEKQVLSDKVIRQIQSDYVTNQSIQEVRSSVQTVSSSITQQADQIALKADQTTVNDINTRLNTAEQKITPTAITSTVRSSTEYTTDLAGKEPTVFKQNTAPTHLSGRFWLDTSVTPNVLNRSNGSAWVKATPTQASEVGAFSATDGSALTGRVSTAESEIQLTKDFFSLTFTKNLHEMKNKLVYDNGVHMYGSETPNYTGFEILETRAPFLWTRTKFQGISIYNFMPSTTVAMYNIKTGVPYTFSCLASVGVVPTGLLESSVIFKVFYYTSVNGSPILLQEGSWAGLSELMSGSLTFTLPSNTVGWLLRMECSYRHSNTNEYAYVDLQNVQLEEGSSVTSFSNNASTISGARYVFNGDNASFYNGGLRIFNKNNTQVFGADTNGDLWVASLKIAGGDAWHTGNFNPNNYSLTNHLHEAIRFADTRSVVDAPQDKLSRHLSLDFKSNTSVGNPPVNASASFSHIITVAGWNTGEGSGGWPTQLSVGEGIAFRRAINATTWDTWKSFWHTGNFNPANYLALSGGTLTGLITGQSGTGAIAEASRGTPSFEAFASGSNASYITFHRGGNYAVRFGLDTDNQLKVGGWSMGAVAHTIWHTGNSNVVHSSGSNANGSWLRFTNGIQICWFNDTGSINASTTTGTQTRWNSKTFTFPAAFNAVPMIASDAFRNGGNLGWTAIQERSATGCSIYILSDFATQSLLSYMAIGTW